MQHDVQLVLKKIGHAGCPLTLCVMHDSPPGWSWLAGTDPAASLCTGTGLATPLEVIRLARPPPFWPGGVSRGSCQEQVVLLTLMLPLVMPLMLPLVLLLLYLMLPLVMALPSQDRLQIGRGGGAEGAVVGLQVLDHCCTGLLHALQQRHSLSQTFFEDRAFVS